MIRDNKKRTDLAKVLPIGTPFVVHIDTCNVCNFQCRFCTTGDRELLRRYNRPIGRMGFELFCILCKSRSRLESDKRVAL